MSADRRPDVSVVVTHYDAADRLALVLAGLAAQTLTAARFEVVVVDDGSPAPPVLPDQPYALRLVRQDDRGFRAAAARNLGAAATTGATTGTGTPAVAGFAAGSAATGTARCTGFVFGAADG